MARYEYQCNRDGVFEITRPLGTAPQSFSCSVCGGEAARTFSVAMVGLGLRPGVFAAIDRAEKSRYEPEIVTSLPAASARRRTPTVPLTPTLNRLPRP